MRASMDGISACGNSTTGSTHEEYLGFLSMENWVLVQPQYASVYAGWRIAREASL